MSASESAQSERLAGQEPSLWYRTGIGVQVRLALLILPLFALSLAVPSAAQLGAPAFSFAVSALLLFTGAESLYAGFCLWLFFLTPLLRRLVDLQVGFNDFPLMMLSPYAALLAAGPVAAVKLWSGPGFPARDPLRVIVVLLIYGFAVAALSGRVTAATFDLIRWLLPISFCVWLITRAEATHTVIVIIQQTMLAAAGPLGAYAVYQYLYLPDWDRYWMSNADMGSIGFPEPMALRVFSTMNSPGSYALTMMACMSWILSSKSVWKWSALAVAGAGLALSSVRSAWLGVCMSLAFLVLRGNQTGRRSVVVLMVAGLAAFSASAIVPDTRRLLEDRLQTLSQLEDDVSYQERSASYRQFLYSLPSNVFGEGIAINAGVKVAADVSAVIIDSGIIEMFRALGLTLGSVFFACFSAILVIALRRPLPSGKSLTIFHGASATSFTLAILLIGGNTLAGEVGMFFWLSIGTCIAIKGPHVASGT